MMILTEPQFLALRYLLHMLLIPPESCTESVWAEECARLFGVLLDEPEHVMLALHANAEPRWYGPGGRNSESREFGDPRRGLQGTSGSHDEKHASVWWWLPNASLQRQADREHVARDAVPSAVAEPLVRARTGLRGDAAFRGAGLWWRDGAGAFSMTLTFQLCRGPRAGRCAGDCTSHTTLQQLLDTLCAPFAAAGRLRHAYGSRLPNHDVMDTGRELSEVLAARYSLTPRERARGTRAWHQ